MSSAETIAEARYDRDVTLIIAATTGSTLVAIAIVVCLGCMYYYRCIKYKRVVQPEPETNDTLSRQNSKQPWTADKQPALFRRPSDDQVEIEHEVSSGEFSTKMPLSKMKFATVKMPLKMADQGILKYPDRIKTLNDYGSEDDIFRSIVRTKHRIKMSNPPPRVTNIYDEGAMLEYEREVSVLYDHIPQEYEHRLDNLKKLSVSFARRWRERTIFRKKKRDIGEQLEANSYRGYTKPYDSDKTSHRGYTKPCGSDKTSLSSMTFLRCLVSASDSDLQTDDDDSETPISPHVNSVWTSPRGTVGEFGKDNSQLGDDRSELGVNTVVNVIDVASINTSQEHFDTASLCSYASSFKTATDISELFCTSREDPRAPSELSGDDPAELSDVTAAEVACVEAGLEKSQKRTKKKGKRRKRRGKKHEPRPRTRGSTRPHSSVSKMSDVRSGFVTLNGISIGNF